MIERNKKYHKGITLYGSKVVGEVKRMKFFGTETYYTTISTGFGMPKRIEEDSIEESTEKEYLEYHNKAKAEHESYLRCRENESLSRVLSGLACERKNEEDY